MTALRPGIQDPAPNQRPTTRDINDRGDILLPGPGALYKGRAVPIGG